VGVFLGVLAVGGVLCFHFPALLTTPDLRAAYPLAWMRRLLAAAIVLAFACGLASTVLRRRKVLGVTAMSLALLAVLMGGSGVPVEGPVGRAPYLGLDWFLLSLLFTALVFAPLERAWPLRPEQSAFRPGWLTDGAYFFASHALVQMLSALIVVRRRSPPAGSRCRASVPGSPPGRRPHSSSLSWSSPTSPSTGCIARSIAPAGSGASTACTIRARRSTGSPAHGSTWWTWW
jgi:hypothetical protein